MFLAGGVSLPSQMVKIFTSICGRDFSDFLRPSFQSRFSFFPFLLLIRNTLITEEDQVETLHFKRYRERM